MRSASAGRVHLTVNLHAPTGEGFPYFVGGSEFTPVGSPWDSGEQYTYFSNGLDMEISILSLTAPQKI